MNAPLPRQTLDFAKLAPQATRHLTQLSYTVATFSIGKRLVDLIFLRISQINGCTFCADMHWRDLIEQGVPPRELNALAVWHEAPFFSPRERAALAWAEALARLPMASPAPALLDDVRAHFSSEETAEVLFAIVTMNAWNRVGVGLALPIEV